MMEIILSRGTEGIPEVDIGSESHWDEDREKRWKNASNEVYDVIW